MRISEYYHLNQSQATLDFIDVELDTDTPLFIDPSALLYVNNEFSIPCVDLIQNFFQTVLDLIRSNSIDDARILLSNLREPDETHFGFSTNESHGTALGPKSSINLAESLTNSAAIQSGLIQDLEDTILLVPGISSDRISDITTIIIRSELIKYTQNICTFYGIPMERVSSGHLWDPINKCWYQHMVALPMPNNDKLLMVPRAIVRNIMNYDINKYYRNYILEYYKEYELSLNSKLVRTLKSGKRVYKKDLEKEYPAGKENIYHYTLQNPALLEEYRIETRRTIRGPLSNEAIIGFTNSAQCNYTDLLNSVINLPKGRDDADNYEKEIENFLTAIFYPSLSFPERQKRIHQGRKRIDLTYTNTSDSGFFKFLSVNYRAPYIFVECKNYSADISNPELDQLAGRFSHRRGQFGILICRDIQDKAGIKLKCKDCANDDRGYIIALDDNDLINILQEFQQNQFNCQFLYLKNLFEELVM